MFIDDASSFFQLLKKHFDISQFISSVFYDVFYQHLKRKRHYSFSSFLSSLIHLKIFSIPTDSFLIFLLHICKELRDFCDFSKVSDAPLFTRFKLGFADHIELMFQRRWIIPGPSILFSAASRLAIKIILMDPYKIAYGLMPSQITSCPSAKQPYINKYFCYADKFAILTNVLGIAHHIAFLNDDAFKAAHPDFRNNSE